jgi:hypothetical protein
LGGKCEFAAIAQRLCQFVKSGLSSDGDFFRDAASPHGRSEPKLTNAAPRTKVLKERKS